MMMTGHDDRDDDDRDRDDDDELHWRRYCMTFRLRCVTARDPSQDPITATTLSKLGPKPPKNCTIKWISIILLLFILFSLFIIYLIIIYSNWNPIFWIIIYVR